MTAPQIQDVTVDGSHRAVRVILSDNPEQVGFHERRVSALAFDGGNCRIELHHGASMDAGLWLSRDDLAAIGDAIGRLLGSER